MVEVQLAKIQGSVDRIMDSQRRAEQDNALINVRLNSHADRITALERVNTEEDGARKARDAMAKSAVRVVQLLWGLCGGIAVAAAALVLQALHT